MNRLASIDIGTNSVRLLVAERTGAPPRIHPLKTLLSIEALGEGLDQSGELKEEVMDRVAGRIDEYAQQARDMGAERIRVYGTAAVREAKNQADFLARVQERAGVTVRVLSGEEEADYTYLGVTRHLEDLSSNENVLVLDIGGGSTEYTVGQGEERRYSQSVPIGSVRLKERSVKSDPPSQEDLGRLMLQVIASGREIIQRVKDEQEKSGPPLRLVGVAGSITTFRTIQLGMTDYNASRVQGTRMALPELLAVMENLKSKNHEERVKIPGLEPKRADTILAGGMILIVSMQLLGLEEITFSDRDGLHGVLLDENEDGWS